MEKIPPSQKIGKRVDQLLRHGLNGEGDVTTTIIRLAVEQLVQEMLEQEATDYLEREHYQRRRPEQEHHGYRNGYEPGCIRTAEGEVVVQAPQVRGGPETYRSELMTFLRGNSDVLQRLAVYESLREQGGLKEGILAAWGICMCWTRCLTRIRQR